MLAMLTLTPGPVVSGFGIFLLLSLFCLLRLEHLRHRRVQSRMAGNLRSFVATTPPVLPRRKRTAALSLAAKADSGISISEVA